MTSIRLVMIEPSPGPDESRPLPIYVDHAGAVQQQGYWRGDPATVVGFADRFDREEVTVPFPDFWADIDKALGRYIVTADEDGSVSALVSVIEKVSVVVDDPATDR